VQQLLAEGLVIDEGHWTPSRCVAPDYAAAFEGAYLAHFPSLYRYVLGLTRSTDEADDITAEVFARAFRAWALGPPPAGRQLPWLLLAARRLATDRWRRAKRFIRLAAADPRRTDEQQQAEFWLWFDALAEVLTERQREVLLLRYQRDLSDEDIGQVMGISPSGVRSLVARALDALRAHPELLE
jgi:RNA polymerase sigma-70 factor (ECF subfamily)